MVEYQDKVCVSGFHITLYRNNACMNVTKLARCLPGQSGVYHRLAASKQWLVVRALPLNATSSNTSNRGVLVWIDRDTKSDGKFRPLTSLGLVFRKCWLALLVALESVPSGLEKYALAIPQDAGGEPHGAATMGNWFLAAITLGWAARACTWIWRWHRSIEHRLGL